MDCNFEKCPAYTLAKANKEAIDQMDHVSIVAKIAVLESKMDTMMQTLTEIAEKPSKRWEALVGAFIGAGGVMVAEMLINR